MSPVSVARPYQPGSVIVNPNGVKYLVLGHVVRGDENSAKLFVLVLGKNRTVNWNYFNQQAIKVLIE